MVPHPVVPARAVHLARVGPPPTPFHPDALAPPDPSPTPFHRGKRDVIKLLRDHVSCHVIQDPRTLQREDAERTERLRTQVTAGGWGCTRRRERA